VDPHLKNLQDEIALAVAGWSTEQLNRHPLGKWCTAEILEHLYLTYTGTSKGFSRILESGRPQGNVPSFKQRAQAFVVVGLGYLPSGREAPPMSRPKGIDAEKVVGEITSKIAEMDSIMASCETKFGERAKVLDHPVLGPFSISQWRKFHLVHGRHHIKQILRLRTLATEG
jgi:hypothetical protein